MLTLIKFCQPPLMMFLARLASSACIPLEPPAKRRSPCTGANQEGRIYQPHITSYDYDCPISEAGGTGQPGIGGRQQVQGVEMLAGTCLHLASTL